MITTNLIRELAQNKLRESDNYLVDVTVSAMNKIRVTIDNVRGVSIQECVTMSRWIENQLGETEDFELEVSSPGLDQPFKVLQQYQKYQGKEVEVKFTDGQKAEGRLLSANEKEIELEQTSKEKVEGKKRKTSSCKTIEYSFRKNKRNKNHHKVLSKKEKRFITCKNGKSQPHRILLGIQRDKKHRPCNANEQPGRRFPQYDP